MVASLGPGLRRGLETLDLLLAERLVLRGVAPQLRRETARGHAALQSQRAHLHARVRPELDARLVLLVLALGIDVDRDLLRAPLLVDDGEDPVLRQDLDLERLAELVVLVVRLRQTVDEVVDEQRLRVLQFLYRELVVRRGGIGVLRKDSRQNRGSNARLRNARIPVDVPGVSACTAGERGTSTSIRRRHERHLMGEHECGGNTHHCEELPHMALPRLCVVGTDYNLS